MTVIDLSAYRVSDAAQRRREAVTALPADPLLMGRTVAWWAWNSLALILTSAGACALLIAISVLAPEHAPR